MDSTPPPPPPPPPSFPEPSPAPPQPVLAHPVAPPPPRSGGFGRIVLALILAGGVLGGVFALGAGAAVTMLGVVGLALGGSGLDGPVLEMVHRDGGRRAIAVLPVEGVIDGRRSSFVRASVDMILANPAIEAVVLRVDSPGGGVTPSDQIWAEVERIRAEGLPVVASFGGVAASGGYYVACGADRIYAEETTITGSIGVIAQVLTLENLMDKVGIEPVTIVATGSPEKDVANDTFRAWNDADRAQVLDMLDSAYTIFVSRVRNGRRTAITSNEGIADVTTGRVFTAGDAKDRGLVDAIGYLDDAIAHAETTAGIAPGRATVYTYGLRPTLLGLPMASAAPARSLDAEHLRSLVNDLAGVRLMYLTNLR